MAPTFIKSMYIALHFTIQTRPGIEGYKDGSTKTRNPETKSQKRKRNTESVKEGSKRSI